MKEVSHHVRLWVVTVFFAVAFVILIWRMLDLTIFNQKFLKNQGEARSVRVLAVPTHRGMITDRYGKALAVSTPIQSVWINPKLFSPTASQWKQLEKYLHVHPQQVLTLMSRMKNREFVYLRRGLTPAEVGPIEILHIPGLYFQQEFKRYYPEGETIAQLLGFTNIDDQGIEGLELAYQDWLSGVSGKKRVIKDRLGRVIEELQIMKEPRPGHDLQLSIDRRIQFFAYHELKQSVERFAAQSGSVVVLDSHSGEVLAIANYPSFNPNLRSHYELNRYRNKALTDSFEPGSVIKPFSIATALENGVITPTTIIDTRPSYMMVHGHIIRDIHNYGVLDVTGVLQRSSNVGVSKMILALAPERLLHLLSQVGIGQRTESGYPGESEGSVVKLADVNPFVIATIGFGYGLSVTALQLAKAYLIFANHGQLLPISLLHLPRVNQPTPVISAKTANEVLNMMEAVVTRAGGTGKLAQIPGYRVAGKTGTARIAGKKGYEDRRYISSFVGIAPISNPRLIVAVVIHEPTKLGYYGGAVAAPLFAKVMGAALRILDIPFDV